MQTKRKNNSDMSLQERRARAKRIKVKEPIEVCVKCPKCETLLALDVPEGSGRQCNCITCNQRLFVHKYTDQESCKQHMNGENFDNFAKKFFSNYLSQVRNQLQHASNICSGFTKPNSVVCSQEGRYSKELDNKIIYMMDLPQEILDEFVLKRLDMCTLSIVDQTCHKAHQGAECVTQDYAAVFNLTLRSQETWGSLRLAIHCMWLMNGFTTGMPFGTNCDHSKHPYHKCEKPGIRMPCKIYSCGSCLFGQTGHEGKVDYVIPCPMDDLYGVNIAMACGGGRHSCMLTESGDLHTCGRRRHGQLGIGTITEPPNNTAYDEYQDTSHNVLKIKESTSAQNDVICVAAGYDHTVVVRKSGAAESFGRGSSGRLGLGLYKRNSYSPERINRVLVSQDDEISAECVKFVSAGSGLVHTAFISDVGDLYTTGHSKNGRLGHDDQGCFMAISDGEHSDDTNAVVHIDTPLPIPRKVQALQGMRIIQAALGSYHTAVLTSKGEVYTFGHGHTGQLGHGNNKDLYTPTKVQGLVFHKDPIVQIAAGYEHTVALTMSGAVYTFGLGERGQLGHGSQHSQSTPKLVKELVRLQVRAVQVSAGGHHTVVRLQDGRVATFGSNESGQLGHGDKENYYVPQIIEDMDGCHARHVSAGGSHTLFLFADKDESSEGM